MSELLWLPTGRSGIYLRELAMQDDQPFFDAIQENPEHLDQHGNRIASDYRNIERVAERREKAGDKLRMGIWDNATLQGSIVASPNYHHTEVEIGYWLRKSAVGQGLATLAVKTMTQHLARDDMRLYAETHINNVASINVLVRANYEFTGAADFDWGHGLIYDYRRP